MLIWILAANLALAALYAIVRRARGESAGMAVYFLFLPVLGFVIYYLPSLLQMFLEKMGIDREAILIRAFEIDLQPEHPDVREALNVVPVEDAMAVSGNEEKRALLLKQLKKDLKEHYRVLLAAERDKDSESIHYAAVAKMEIYHLQQTRWLECRRDYAQDPGDPEKYHTACQVLTEMLGSGILSSREQSACQNACAAWWKSSLKQRRARFPRKSMRSIWTPWRSSAAAKTRSVSGRSMRTGCAARPPITAC